MVDKTLLTNYVNAVQARGLVKHLPPGLREHALMYENMCLEDIRAQLGNQALTESDVLKMAEPTLKSVIITMLPMIGQVVGALLKKYYPTAAIAGTLSALISYVAAMLQK